MLTCRNVPTAAPPTVNISVYQDQMLFQITMSFMTILTRITMMKTGKSIPTKNLKFMAETVPVSGLLREDGLPAGHLRLQEGAELLG